MNASRNRKLGVLAVVIVALAAGGAALAASKLHGSGTTSGRLGGPPGFSGGSGSGTFGRPPSGYFGNPGNGGGFRGRGFGGGGPFGGLSAATSYLGISESELRSQLASGKTLAQIANSTSGKSAAGLIDAMVAAQKKELDQAVSSGRISQSTADQIEAHLKSRVTDMVNGTFHRFGGGVGGGPPQGFGNQGRQQAPTNTTPSTHI
jgi:hypothetical protein